MGFGFQGPTQSLDTPLRTGEARDFVIRPSDPILAGHGPARAVQYRADFSGRLCVWAMSADIDPFLRVENGSGLLLAEDDDSGGGGSACIELSVAPGDELTLRAATNAVDRTGAFTLRVTAAPETEATLAAAAGATERLAQAERLRGQKAFAEARTAIETCVSELTATPGGGASPSVCTALARASVLARDLGCVKAAVAACSAVLGQRERTLPRDHPLLQEARLALALALELQGELRAAFELEQAVVEVRERCLPPDHRDLQLARMCLAVEMKKLGDLHGAHLLFQGVVEVYSRTLPYDDPLLQDARQNLAITTRKLGDLHGARELEEMVLEVLSRTQSDDGAELQVARQNLALTLIELGELSRARELEQNVLEVRVRQLPDDHPALQAARQNLAITMKLMGDAEDARALEEKVLEVRSRGLPADHPGLQKARANLAVTLRMLGDVAGARALQEQVLAVRSLTLPADHRDLLEARRNLIWTVASCGEGDLAQAESARLAAGLRTAIERMLESYAPREVEARAIEDQQETSALLSIAAGAGRFPASAELDRIAFELVEMQRGAALSSARLLQAAAGIEGIEELRARVRDASERVAYLATGDADPKALADAVLRRDAAERQILSALKGFQPGNLLLRPPDGAALASAIDADTALVGYWAYTRTELDASEPPRATEVRSLLAFVQRKDAPLARVELGPLAQVEAAVTAWNSAVRSQRKRGAPATGSEPDPLRPAGENLRRLVLDPLLPAIGDAHRLVVALDDELHVVALDALPLGEGFVGDAYGFEVRATLWELLVPPPGIMAPPVLLAFGEVEYDPAPAPTAEGSPPDPAERRDRDAIASRRASEASRTWQRAFQPLPATGQEVRRIESLFTSTFADKGRATVLTREQATKAALIERAPAALYLHLATHGYFAPESIVSLADEEPIDPRLGIFALSRGEQVRGLSPMVLCGLALAGANGPKGPDGRIPGTITAEEIAALDLSACELVVLSACETNLGARRAGKGVATLQQALQMAGARSVITSLWVVDDEAARELMVDFYRRIWVQGKSMHTALWEAKQRLRQKRDERGRAEYALRDWAGWVLTGESE